MSEVRSRSPDRSFPHGVEGEAGEVGPMGAFPGRAIARATGSPRIEGNQLSLQFEGALTFEAWIDAIQSARRFVHFENYIVRDDRIGREFRDVLVARAREGIEVRLLYDWVGCWATPRRYWKPFREAGVEVRAFNRPSLRDPLGIIQRDHRKLVCVDGTVAFLGGFCVGEAWAGLGDRPPWRDTGVEIRGPAAAAAARAFERIWVEEGDPIPESSRCDPSEVTPVGNSPVWLIEGAPWRTRVYRETQVVAAAAEYRIWITDPYFVAPPPVSDALAASARDGVDVRVLLPAHNNWPLVGSLSRGGYRGLLKAGVRLFEWQGPMIHAKTLVADGIWSRIGSSNLNAASLLGNWEIDVGVLDEDLARQLEGLFLADLGSSVEILLPRHWLALSRASGTDAKELDAAHHVPIEASGTLQERLQHWGSITPGHRARWALADLVRAGSVLGEALAGRRPLGREDRTVLGTVSVVVLLLAGVAALLPALAGWMMATVLAWLGIVTGVRAFLEARRAAAEDLRMGREDIEDSSTDD